MSGADLSGADLREADLRSATFRDLSLGHRLEANLSGVRLFAANMSGTDLSNVNFSRADLSNTDLSGANLGRGIFTRANLSHSQLSGANFEGALLLEEANFTGAKLTEEQKKQLLERGAIYLEEQGTKIEENTGDTVSNLRIRITEEPLTASNLTTIISALTELSTKCWLIVKGRFADLIEYTQTHNPRFSEESNTIITSISHNSPADIGFKIDLSPEGLAKAVNDVAKIKQNLKKVELENQEKAEQIQQSAKKAEQDYQAKQQERLINAQKAAQESQMGQLEQEKQKFELEKQRLIFQIELEKQKFELEKQRLELVEKRLEIQRKEIEYALEIASELIDALQPNADQATRAMAIQTLLPNILQLQNGKGLELALPAPQNSGAVTEITETTGNG